MMKSLNRKAEKLKAGEINKEQYDTWIYTYPDMETSYHFAKVIPKDLSDMLIKEFDEIEKEEVVSIKKVLLTFVLENQ